LRHHLAPPIITQRTTMVTERTNRTWRTGIATTSHFTAASCTENMK
jgi:hypothetical protein